MYATAVFEFRQSDNGWLMSGFAFMRAAFLIFLFPYIIKHGRRWHLARDWTQNSTRTGPPTPSRLATNPEELEAPIGSLAEEEPVGSGEAKEDEGTEFDLFFLRVSLVVDGLLTMCAAFATEKWHIYLGTSNNGGRTNRHDGSADIPELPACSPLPRVRPRRPRA